jgi:hypothetical protein
MKPGRPVLFAAVLAAVVVLGIRAGALVEREASPLALWHFWTETDEYAAIASAGRIAAGNWRDVPAYRPYFSWQALYGTPEQWDEVVPRNVPYQGPAYPYFLAAARVAGPSQVLAVRLAQLLLAVLASSLLAAAAAAVLLRSGRTPRLAIAAGTLAGVLHGTFGPLVFLDGFLYRDGPVAHLSALLLALPLLLPRPARARDAALVGAVAGVGALFKQTLLPLGLVAGAVVVLGAEAGKARKRAAVALVAALLLVLAPLLARNAAVGAPLLAFDTRPLVGIPWANARGADGSVAPSPLLMDVLREAKGSTLRAAILTLGTWRDDPSGLAILMGRKLASAFNAAEIPDNASFFFFRERLQWLAPLPLFPWLLGPGVAGLAAASRRGLFRKGEAVLAATAALVPLGACLLVSTTTRYRVGAAAPLALGVALLAGIAFGKVRERTAAPSALPWLGLAAVLTAQAFLPSPVRSWPFRWVDTVVTATLTEARFSPEQGAEEIRQWLDRSRTAPDRRVGLASMRRWLMGEREFTRIDPAAIAPPERRYTAVRR